MSLRNSDRLVRCELGHVHWERFTTTHNLNPSIGPARHRPGVRS